MPHFPYFRAGPRLYWYFYFRLIWYTIAAIVTSALAYVWWPSRYWRYYIYAAWHCHTAATHYINATILFLLHFHSLVFISYCHLVVSDIFAFLRYCLREADWCRDASNSRLSMLGFDYLHFKWQSITLPQRQALILRFRRFRWWRRTKTFSCAHWRVHLQHCIFGFADTWCYQALHDAAIYNVASAQQ